MPASLSSSALFWIALASATSFLLTCRLFWMPMVSDEGGYAFVAERWFDGRGELYHDLWISRPQAIFVVYGAVIELFGGSTIDFRLVAWACGVLTMIAVWAIARRWRGPRVAAGATMLFGLMMGSPAIEGFTANAEIFMALPAAVSILTLQRAFARDWNPGWLLATGALAGLATQLKPSGIVMLGVAGVFIASMALDSGRFERLMACRFGAVLAGFGLSLTPAIYHGYRIGWDAFIHAAVTYRLTQQSTATGSLYHHAKGVGFLSLRIWPLYAAVALIFLTRYLTAPERRTEPRVARRSRLGQPAPMMGIVAGGYLGQGVDPIRLLIKIWIVGCLFGISMGGDWWYHYLIQITAPLAIWLAISFDDLRQRISRKWQHVLGAGMVFAILLPYVLVAGQSRTERTDQLFGHPGYAVQEVVGDYIQEHTLPEATLFVAFNQAALYYLADRPSPYPYLYDQELRAFPEANTELIAMIESRERPQYIVGTRQLAPFADRGLAFWEAVQRHYVLETVIRGVPIYRARAEPPLPLIP